MGEEGGREGFSVVTGMKEFNENKSINEINQ